MTDTTNTEQKNHVPEGFADYYNATIEPELDRLDQKRRRGAGFIIGCGVLFVLGLLVSWWLSQQGMGGNISTGAGLVASILAALGMVLAYKHTRGIIKTALVEPGCEFLGYSYRQKPEDFPVERFYELRLIRRRNETKTQVEDEISGTHNGLAFRLCEVEITDQSDDKDDNGSKNKNRLFHGILFVSEFPRSFSGETRVLNSADRTLLPKSALDGSALESVHLEESQFSQTFHVYSSDQIEARYVLNPRFMEQLVELSVHFNPGAKLPADKAEAIEQSWLYQKMMSLAKSVSVAFVDNQMLIAISTEKDCFEGGSLFKTLKDRERVEALLVELQVVPQILDTLSLERR